MNSKVRDLGMNEWLILAGTTAKTSGDHIRGILAMILIPAVIIVIAVLAGISGKKKKAKFMETLSKEHPFKESYKNVHITEDKLLIIESANVGKVYNNSCLINGNNNNKGFLSIVYKLDEVAFVCPFTHTVRIVNKYGHGNQATTTYVFNVLNSEMDPIVPDTAGKKTLSKGDVKKITKGEVINGSAFEDDHDLKEVVAMIQRNASHVQQADYEKMEERKKTRNYMAKK